MWLTWRQKQRLQRSVRDPLTHPVTCPTPSWRHMRDDLDQLSRAINSYVNIRNEWLRWLAAYQVQVVRVNGESVDWSLVEIVTRNDSLSDTCLRVPNAHSAVFWCGDQFLAISTEHSAGNGSFVPREALHVRAFSCQPHECWAINGPGKQYVAFRVPH